jgi:hypothetical protein
VLKPAKYQANCGEVLALYPPEWLKIKFKKKRENTKCFGSVFLKKEKRKENLEVLLRGRI